MIFGISIRACKKFRTLGDRRIYRCLLQNSILTLKCGWLTKQDWRAGESEIIVNQNFLENQLKKKTNAPRYIELVISGWKKDLRLLY